MESKELVKQIREMIKQEEALNVLRKQKDAEYLTVCNESYDSPKYKAYREKYKDVPFAKSFHMTGINPVSYGGPHLDYVTALYCFLAHLRGRQHIIRVRVAGSLDSMNYAGDGVMVVINVTPEMYESFVQSIQTKLFPLPPAPKPVDKKVQALIRFVKELEEKPIGEL